jgi:hypothetical protein
VAGSWIPDPLSEELGVVSGVPNDSDERYGFVVQPDGLIVEPEDVLKDFLPG